MNLKLIIATEKEKENLESELEHLKSVKDELHSKLETVKKISQAKSWQLEKYEQERKERKERDISELKSLIAPPLLQHSPVYVGHYDYEARGSEDLSIAKGLSFIMHKEVVHLCRYYRRVRIISPPSILFAPTQTKTFPSGLQEYVFIAL